MKKDNDKDIKLPKPVFWFLGSVAILFAFPNMLRKWIFDNEKAKGFL